MIEIKSKVCREVLNQSFKIEMDKIFVWQNDEWQEISDEQYEIINTKIPEFEAKDKKQQIEQSATAYIKKQLKALDYDNEGEVALYASNPNSEWHDEAVALQKWVEDVYKKMYELQNNVTVDNYKDIDLDKIEAEYPAFEFNE